MLENFTKLLSDTKTQIQETQTSIADKLNIKNQTWAHVMANICVNMTGLRDAVRAEKAFFLSHAVSG